MIYHCCFNFNIPMAKVVRHLFMYLFAICKLSLVNCPLISFVSFLIGFFLLWSFKYFSYIQDTSPLSDIHSKYFLLVCNFYFHTLNRVFCTEKKKKKKFNMTKSSLSNFPFMHYAFWIKSKSSLTSLKSSRLSTMFFSKGFIVLCFIFELFP